MGNDAVEDREEAGKEDKEAEAGEKTEKRK